MNEKNIFRVIDANLNRLREGLRVCEEVTRLVLEDKKHTLMLKRIRHDVLAALESAGNLSYASLVAARDSEKDIGKFTIREESRRDGGISDILNANLERSKESVRVLEEFFKTIDLKTALRFKKMRFDIYIIEKSLMHKLHTAGRQS